MIPEPAYAAIILAGGASRRMGAPKALLEWQGQCFLDRLIELFAQHCRPVIVALGHGHERIRAALRRTDQAEFVINTNPERGQLSSLQTALAAVPPTARGILFTPVDYPAFQPETVAALIQTLDAAQGGELLAIPRCEGHRGHPICAARPIIAELLALPAETGQAREVIHRHRGRTIYVDVDDPGILQDIDEPQHYQALLNPDSAL